MQRIVVKVGTKAISTENGGLDETILENLADQITALRRKGVEVVLVTSGAVGAGRGLIKTKEKQVLAAVGQVKLMSLYAELFRKRGHLCAQVLVTKEDFRDRIHYFNMQSCLENLLQEKVLPIVNENDVIATTELFFTDNDELAGLLASQLNADTVIILTSVDGVLADGKIIPEINFSTIQEIQKHITPEKSTFGRGGMLTKFAIAKKLALQGITTYIANGKKSNVLIELLRGEVAGTKFIPQKKLSALKRRLAYSEGLTRGTVAVNDCTEEMLLSQKKIMSLLPVGITAVSGNFKKGDIVEIVTPHKKRIGFGVAQYDSEKARLVIGKKNMKPFLHYNYLFIDG